MTNLGKQQLLQNLFEAIMNGHEVYVIKKSGVIREVKGVSKDGFFYYGANIYEGEIDTVVYAAAVHNKRVVQVFLPVETDAQLAGGAQLLRENYAYRFVNPENNRSVFIYCHCEEILRHAWNIRFFWMLQRGKDPWSQQYT